MDPVQLQLMQQMSLGQVPGIPGMQAPLTTGGASMLAATGQQYAPPIAGNPFPDTSPLAPLGLQRFGMIGMLGGIAGNAMLTQMMEQQGVLPMGNAGSYMQAYRAREFRNMQQEVGQAVAGQDAESFYRTFRGGAAMLGMPFNREQREAARSLANTIAEFGPTLAVAAPQVLDALAGERGSVQAMAAQMMEANRYQIDPTTGRMGYGAQANADMVNEVFSTMFAEDNMARMQGMRAGDMGQLYRQLAPEGLVGPQGSLRDRTLRQLNAARDAGQLEAIGAEAGVDVDGNLAGLSNAELQKLRETGPMRERMTQADARQVSSRLQDYVGTLSAMREVFGENGNPNAPIPQLIGALEALTSGQMHKFDAARLQTMVRDMQALSQMSGKSVDQILAMNQANAAQGQALGIGTTFSGTATNVGVLTGMAFQERGGATGFGALSREEAEQAGSSYFNRGMASETSNVLGTLGRIEQAGGFADNPAGRRLSAIMEAARAGERTYFDPTSGEERDIPLREADYRSLIGAGAVPGMNMGSFNMMLADRTSNLRFLHEDPELQQAAFQQQSREVDSRIARQVGNRLSGSQAMRDSGMNARQRNAASRAMGRAATEALSDLSPQEIQDPETRNRAIADALQMEAANQGVTLSDEEALNMAPSVFGQAENAARYFGFESYTAYSQVLGEDVSEARNERAAQASARSGLNQALSGLGPQGGLMQRFFTAVQKQGDRGGEANLQNLMTDMFGADIDRAEELMLPELQAIAAERGEIQDLTAELEGASPERRRELRREISQRTEALEARVQAAQELGEDFGLGGGEEVFNREDLMRARDAERNLEHFNRSDQVRMLAARGNVTGGEREAAADTEFTMQDAAALASARRTESLEYIENLDVEDVDAYDRAMNAAESLTEEDIARLPEDVRAVYEQTMEETSGLISGGDKEAALSAAKEYMQQQASSLSNLPDDARQIFESVLAETGNENAALARAKQHMRENLGSLEDFTATQFEKFRSLDVGQLSQEQQDTIIRSRRSRRQIAPTAEQIDERLEELQTELGEEGDLETDREIELTEMAENQLLAENQLRALGQLGEEETLMADADDIRDFSGLDLDLKTRLAEADVGDRAGIVSEYLDRQTQQQFYGQTAEEVEENRRQAVAQMGTAEGRQSIRDTEANVETMIDVRRQFLMDEDAATRLGASRSLRAVERSREAEQELQDMANRYYNGSVGNMLASGGIAMDAEGAKLAEEDFANLTQEQREEVAARLSEAGPEVEVGDLTAQNYKAYLALKARDQVGELTAANRELMGAVDESLLAEDLGVTQEQLDALQSMASLEVGDVSETAEKLGMTEEEYRAAMRGGEIDESLRLFSGEDAAEQLREAKSDESRHANLQVKLQKVQAEIAETGGSDTLREEERRLKEMMQPITDRREERMRAAGLDPTKEEDVQAYQKRLQNQGDLQMLEKRRTEYMERRSELKELGLTDEQIDEKLGTMSEMEEEAQEKMEAFRRLDLKPAEGALAEAFGIDTTQVSDELTEFKADLGGGGAGAERTKAMVAGVLDRIEGIDIGDRDATAIEKLDMLTDQYAEASPDERKALAQKHGMDIKDLDRMMRQTEFMGMREDEGDYTSEDFKSAMQRVQGRDIAEEVAKEEERQMKLTGTVTVRGVVNGEGTFDDVTGATVR